MIQNVIDPLTKEGLTKQPPKQLEVLRGKVLHFNLAGYTESGANARIVTSEAAAVIIEYYTYESKVKNELALKSFRKFAKMGIDTWIKQVTGYREKPQLTQDDINDTLKLLMHSVEVLSYKVEKLDNFQRATVTLPGLASQFDAYSKPETTLDSIPFTLDSWLKARGIELTHGQISGMGRMLADLYKINRQALPKKVRANTVGKAGGGWRTVYTADDEPMIEAALAKLLA